MKKPIRIQLRLPSTEMADMLRTYGEASDKIEDPNDLQTLSMLEAQARHKSTKAMLQKMRKNRELPTN